jgi:hypothetical protein
MKKQVTLFAGLLLFAGVSTAQKVNNLPARAKNVSTPSLYSGKITSEAGSSEKTGGDILWSNNFSSATNWQSTAVGATPAANFGWQIATAPNSILTWAFTSGINSTSDGGYAVCENGDPTVTPGTQIPGTEWILTYDSIFDFSGVSDLIFQFEEYGASFIEKQSVEVSTNGGTTWIEIGNNNDLGQLTSTGGSAFPNPTLRKYNVTYALGGSIPASLKFRFRVTWPGNAGNNSGIMYGWFVDDVKFIEGYSNDLKIANAYTITNGLSYTKFPSTQATNGNAQTIVTAKVMNMGSASQDATLIATNGAYTGTFTQTIAGFSSDSLVVDPAYVIPTTVGVANFATHVEAAVPLVNTADDSKTLKFEVTPSIMAVDSYTGVGSSMTGAFTTFVGQGANEYTGVGTQFEIFEDGVIGAFEVGIANITGSTNQAPYLNKEFYVSFYRWDGATWVYETETDPRILVAANFGKIVKFYLPDPIQVTQGDGVIAIVTSFVGSEVPVGFAGFTLAGNTVGLAGTSVDDLTGLASDDATPTLVEAPVVRLDFKSYVGLEEIANVAGVSAYPNPFNNSTDINFDLKADAEVAIVVTDLAGRTVLTIPAANFAAGQHTVTLDGSSFNAGVYNYTLTVGGSVITNRIVKK